MKTYLNINSIQDKSIPGSKLEESYVSQENGKGLSTNDFTDILKNKLLSLNNYDDSELNEKILKLEQNLNSILGEGSTEAIENFNEIISFLSGIEDSESLDNIIAAIELQISNKQDKINDLQKIREGASKGETSLQSIPEEYITNSELETKGYLTEHQDITPEILQNENEVAIKVGNNTSNYTTINYSKFSNDLTGRIEATPEEFTFRPSAGDKSIRDESALIKKIKGNTIVWNQLAQKERYIAYNKQYTSLSYSNDIATVTVLNFTTLGYQIGAKLSYYIPRFIGHKYLFVVQIKSDVNMTFGVEINTTATLFNEQTTSDFREYSCIETSDKDGTTTCLISPRGYFEEGKNTYYFKKPQCFDLTQMFGAGNEPTTVEEFKALFPNDYYDYNAGELVSMSSNGLFANGFNQWDEQWETGYIGNNGNDYAVSNTIRSSYIPVITGESYYCHTGFRTSDKWDMFLYGYDDKKAPIFSFSFVGNTVVTIPNGISYIRFGINPDINYGPTYKGNININLSHTGVRNGEYEPYWDATKDLSIIQKNFPNGMRSAGSVYDEISFDEATQKWVAIQRVGERAFVEGDNENAQVTTNGTNTHYELAEPIITTIEETVDLSYKVGDFGIEKMLSDSLSAPFKADIIYQFNATDRVRENSINISKLSKKHNLLKSEVDALESKVLTTDAQTLTEEQQLQVAQNLSGIFVPISEFNKMITRIQTLEDIVNS